MSDDKEQKHRKFDVVIGNPPYQQEGKGDNARDEPIYNEFMDETYKLSDLVELITPGRFLFNAGQTSKKWNEKILNDPHIKLVKYINDSNDVFPGTDIKGGVAVTLRDQNRNFDPIGIFTPFSQLSSIANKVWKNNKSISLSNIVSSRGTYRFSDAFFNDNPTISEKLSKGSGNMITSNAFEKMPEIFESSPSRNDSEIKMLGRIDGQRTYKYIKRKYVNDNAYINCYKVMVPEANGTGALGEILSTPLTGAPFVGATDTFISIGSFKTNEEANNALKYIKTKFVRALLGIRKATQHNPKSTWKFVPLQDFTSKSDIDWSQSIDDIDQQLYKKYGLSDDEINFIETHVKEMD